MAVLLLQFLTHMLDQKTAPHRHSRELVQMMYKELMILGVVALGIFFIEVAGFHISADSKHNFEVIHMSLFIVAVLYAILVVVLLSLSRWLSQRWTHTEELEFEHYQEICEEKEELRMYLRKQGFLRRIVCDNRKSRHYLDLLSIVRFHEMRMRFIHVNDLQDDFPLSYYLKKAKQHVFLELLEIHESGWAFFVLACSVDIYARGAHNGYATMSDPSWILVGGLATVAVACLVLLGKMQYVHYTVIHAQVLDIDTAKHDAAVSWKDLGNAVKPSRRMTVRKLSSSGGMLSQADVKKLNRRDSVKSVLEVDGQEFNQLELFWLRSPELIIRAVQLLVFLLSVIVALLVQGWSSITQHHHGALVLALGLTVIVGFMWFVAHLVPLYTFNAYTGELMDSNLLDEVIKKQEEKRRKEAAAIAAAATDMRSTRAHRERATWAKWLNSKVSTHTATSLFFGVFLVHFFFVAVCANDEFANNGVKIAQCVTAALMLAEVSCKLYVSRSVPASTHHSMAWVLFDFVLTLGVAASTVAVAFFDTSGKIGAVALVRLLPLIQGISHHVVDPRAAHMTPTTEAPSRRRHTSIMTRARMASIALAEPIRDLTRLDTVSNLDDMLNIRGDVEDRGGAAMEDVIVEEEKDSSVEVAGDRDVAAEVDVATDAEPDAKRDEGEVDAKPVTDEV